MTRILNKIKKKCQKDFEVIYHPEDSTFSRKNEEKLDPVLNESENSKSISNFNQNLVFKKVLYIISLFFFIFLLATFNWRNLKKTIKLPKILRISKQIRFGKNCIFDNRNISKNLEDKLLEIIDKGNKNLIVTDCTITKNIDNLY